MEGTEVSGTPSVPGVEEVKWARPEIHNIEDFWCWLNTWGDLHAKHEARMRPDRLSTEWRKGYERAISDALSALAEAGVDTDDVPDKAWSRWTGL